MSIRTRFLIIALCLGVALALPRGRQASAQSANPDRQFQAAIQKEEIDGDLKGAITVYEGLAARRDLPRPLAASVLLRLAECYRKQGHQKAAAVYARIVRDYKDQTAAYKAALAHVPSAPTSHEPRVRTVWTGPNVDLFGQVSPDGTLLTYTDWTHTGNLMVHDLRTGADRALTTKKTWDDGPGEAGWSTVSRDGKTVAYAWHVGKGYEVRLIPLDGSAPPRTLVPMQEDITFLNPFDWSSDGEWIAAGVQRKDGTGQVALIGTRNGTLRVLHSMEWKGPNRIFFSRDGRFVAFDRVGGDDQVQRDIVVMAVDASRAVTAVQHTADDRLVGWSPDGACLIFTSDRTGDEGLWALPIADGVPTGAPVLLRPSTGGFSLGVTDDGRVFVHKGVGTRDVQVATLDLGAGRIDKARGFDRGFHFDARAPAFSPDGRSLAYQACGGECIAVRSVGTGEVRRIPSFYSVDPRWSPDGTTFITAARDQRGRNGIFRVDVTTGAVVPIVLGPPFGAMPQWALDGRSVYYRNGSRIIRRDIPGERDDEITNVSGLGTFELSPDGRWIAVKARDNTTGTSKLLLMPAEGGTAVEWLTASKGEELGGLRQLVWTPDSAGILVTKRTQAGFEVWHLPRQGEPRKLTVDVEGWPVQRSFANAFSLSPDGRTVAFLVGTASQEVWSLENVLPGREKGSGEK